MKELIKSVEIASGKVKRVRIARRLPLVFIGGPELT